MCTCGATGTLGPYWSSISMSSASAGVLAGCCPSSALYISLSICTVGSVPPAGLHIVMSQIDKTKIWP